jgi:predicted GIY-YIG superfamily endonuclease
MKYPKEALKEIVKSDGLMETLIYYDHSSCFCTYVKIYTLSDKSGNIFYVGCTSKTLEKRLRGHLSDKSNIKKNNRIKELNNEVFINLIEEKFVSAEKAIYAQKRLAKRELYWINKFIELGYDLCQREAEKAKRIFLLTPMQPPVTT